jgi:ferredoxin-NADP reductase
MDVVGGEELADLARENPNLTYIRAITRDRPQREGDIQGRFDCDGVLGFMRKHTPQPSGVFVCGSNDFVEALAGCFVGAGIPAERVKTERFGG